MNMSYCKGLTLNFNFFSPLPLQQAITKCERRKGRGIVTTGTEIGIARGIVTVTETETVTEIVREIGTGITITETEVQCWSYL